MLKVHATAWLSDSTSASALSFVISASIRFSLSASGSPENVWPCRLTGASGSAGRSLQTASTGLVSTATSSAPALAQAELSFSAAAVVCSQGSKPRRSPAARCCVSQVSGGGSISDSTAQALVSTCLAACSVYRPSTKTAASRASTTAIPAEPVKPVSQASRSSDGGTYSFCC